jgi:hypothetical protein
MARAAASETSVDRLVAHLVGGRAADALAMELGAWLGGSARFRAFADAHRDKIRKKLRTAPDADALRDVRAELRVAYLLLTDRRIDLAFEAYGAGRGGPDFTVTFRAEQPFNVEVTRLRGTPTPGALAGSVLAKLRQLPPSLPNALLIAIEGARPSTADVDAAARSLRARADAGEATLLSRGHFDGTRAFYERYLRLGVVLAWAEASPGEAGAAAWINRSARIAIPERGLRACLAALRAG